MNQLQFEFGIIPTNINKDCKAEYIETLIDTRENDDIKIFRKFMFDEHLRNLEQMIQIYQASINDEGPQSKPDVGISVGINEQKVLKLIRMNHRITTKEIANTLLISVPQGKRIVAGLKEKGLIRWVGSNKSGHWKCYYS